MLGIMAPAIAVAGIILPAKVIAFYDNEAADRINRVVYRLADAYITPEAFRYRYGPKQILYTGYHEFAYLHPARFAPDPSILARYGIGSEERLIVLRFVGMWSSHDISERGFTPKMKIRMARELSKHGRVLISSEAKLPPELESFRAPVAPQHMHHLLSQAHLLVGESSTMASEACLLGVPSIYLARTGRGVNDDQEARYGHTFCFSDEDAPVAMKKALELASRPVDAVGRAALRRRIATENSDITGAMLAMAEHGSLDRESLRTLFSSHGDSADPGNRRVQNE
jgi:predicted glycosyltransferase